MGKASISISISSAFNSVAIDKAASSLSKLSSSLSRAEKMTAASAMSSTRDLARWGQQAEELGSKWQAAGRKMADVGDSLTKAVTVPMVAVGAYASKMAIDFDTSMANLRKVSDMTQEELEGFAQSALELSKVQPVDASTILNVEALGKQLGVSQGSLEKFATTVTGLDIATNMDAETAGTELARFANIVGMTEDKFENYGSVLVNIGNTMATTESEVSQMAQRFASAGSQAGLTEAEILAMSGAMSSLGIKAEMGGSALSQVFVNISKQVANGGSKLEAFASAAGMSADEFAAAWRGNAADAFNELIEGIGRASAAGTDMNVIMADLGITQIRQSDVMRRLAGSTEAVTGKTSVLGSALAESRKAWEENTALQAEVDQRNESMASRLQVLKNRVDAIAITVGRPLVEALIDATDALSPVIDAVAKAAQAFADMDEEGQRNALMWAAVAAGAGPALSVLGRGAQLFGSIAKGADSAAEKLAVYGDAMSTADGNQLRTYASAKSLSSQMGITRNAAVKAAGGVENYMSAWDGMNLAAGRVKKSEAEIVKLMGQAQTATGKSRESIIERGDALFAQIQTEKKAYESNAKLVAGWSGSAKEAEKAAYGVKSLGTSYNKVAKQLETGAVNSKTASKAFAAMKSESEKASSTFSSKFSPALQTFGQKAKSAGLMALDLGKNIASMALQGAAIAAVTVAIGAIASEIAEADRQQRLMAEATKSATDVMASASGASKGYAESLADLSGSGEDALQSIVDVNNEVKDTFSSVSSQSGVLDAYVSTIAELGNQSQLTSYEHEKLENAVSEYNKITGDSIGLVDEQSGMLRDQSGAIIENTDLIKENAAEWKRNAEQKAYQEVAAKYLEKQVEAQGKYEEAVYRVTEARRLQHEAEERYKASGYTDDEAADAAYRYATEASNAENELNKLAAASESAAEKARIFSDAASLMENTGVSEALAASEQSVTSFATALADTGITVQEFSALNDEQMAALAQAYDGSSASIRSALDGMGVKLSQTGSSAKLSCAEITASLGKISPEASIAATKSGVSMDLLASKLNMAGATSENMEVVSSAAFAGMLESCGGDVDRLVAKIMGYNDTKLQDKSAKADVNTTSLDYAIGAVDRWNSKSLGDKWASMTVQQKYTSLHVPRAAGGIRTHTDGGIRYHARGSIVNAPGTGYPLDMVGEAGAEAIVPLTNKRYAMPFVRMIADETVKRAVRSASEQQGAVQNIDSRSYTVNIDGARIESSSPRALEAIRVLFDEYNITNGMGVA